MSETTSGAAERTTIAAVGVVAAVGAILSYWHMHELAERVGEGWQSWLLPLAVDGLVVAASMTMVSRRHAGKSPGVLAWVSMVAGIAASLAANVAAASPSAIGRIIAAWPPVALLLAYELLMGQIRAKAQRRAVDLAAATASPLPVDCRPDEPVLGSVPDSSAGAASGTASERQPADLIDTAPLPVLAAPAAPRLHLAAVMPQEDDPEAARQAARQYYREVITAGGTCTGKELADRHRKSERWGRDQIRAVRDELDLVGASAR